MNGLEFFKLISYLWPLCLCHMYFSISYSLIKLSRTILWHDFDKRILGHNRVIFIQCFHDVKGTIYQRSSDEQRIL